jgi:hypothetical protein
MEQIHEATDETVFLCVRRGYEAVCIERIDGLLVKSMALLLGARFRSTSVPPRARCWQLRLATSGANTSVRSTSSPTRRTRVTKRALFARLDEVREAGFAVSDEDVSKVIAALGAPIFDYSGRARAAFRFRAPVAKILGENAATTAHLICAGGKSNFDCTRVRPWWLGLGVATATPRCEYQQLLVTPEVRSGNERPQGPSARRALGRLEGANDVLLSIEICESAVVTEAHAAPPTALGPSLA